MLLIGLVAVALTNISAGLTICEWITIFNNTRIDHRMLCVPFLFPISL